MTLVQYKKIIQEALKKYFKEYRSNSSYSSTIWDSMEYTTLLDGKRLRAIMCLETAKSLGVDIQKAIPLAAAKFASMPSTSNIASAAGAQLSKVKSTNSYNFLPEECTASTCLA